MSCTIDVSPPEGGFAFPDHDIPYAEVVRQAATHLGVDTTEGNADAINVLGSRDRLLEYELLRDAGLPVLPRVDVHDIAYGEAPIPEGPCVIKPVWMERGLGKFIVEKPEDWRTTLEWAQGYLRARPQQSRQIIAEPFIEGPSDFATSLRMVTTSGGKILAAGLMMSAQPVLLSELPRLSTELEDLSGIMPNSLIAGSKEFRSNLSCGGKLIPLSTSYASVLTEPDAETQAVAVQNGMEVATHPSGVSYHLPYSYETLARSIGDAIGSKVGLVLGIDVIIDQLLQGHILEVNRSVPYAGKTPGKVFGNPTILNEARHQVDVEDQLIMASLYDILAK